MYKIDQKMMDRLHQLLKQDERLDADHEDQLLLTMARTNIETGLSKETYEVFASAMVFAAMFVGRIKQILSKEYHVVAENFFDTFMMQAAAIIEAMDATYPPEHN